MASRTCYGRLRQPGEVVRGDDAEVAPAAAGVRPQQPAGPRITLPGPHQLRPAVPVDTDHIHGGQVIHGQPVLPRQEPVSAAHDVAAHPDRVAGTARQGEVVLLEQRLVHIPEGGAPLHADQAGPVQGHGLHPAQVDDDAAVVPGREVLVAVTPAAHRDPQARIMGPLDGGHGLAGVPDHLDVGRAADPSPVEAHPQGGVPGVGRVNRRQAMGRGWEGLRGTPKAERARAGQQAAAGGKEPPSPQGLGRWI